METLINLFCYYEKLFIHRNTWIAGRDLMKHYYLIKSFYSKLNLENITAEDYTHAKKVFEQFELKNVGDYNDIYVHSDTLLLADIFENFR